MIYLLALHGLPRAGKGTASSILIERYGYGRVGFGDAVYAEVAQTFGVRETELRSHIWKTEPQNLLSTRCSDNKEYRDLLKSMGENPDTPRESRYHLRRWATEYRRAKDPMHWVKEADRQLRFMGGPVVVDDLRFLDSEYPYLRSLAQCTSRELRVVEIVRPGYKSDASHVSDTRLPEHLIDITLRNIENSPEVLQDAIIGYLYNHGK